MCALPRRYTRLKSIFAVVRHRHPLRPLPYYATDDIIFLAFFPECQSGPIHAIGIDLWIIPAHVSFRVQNNLNFPSQWITKKYTWRYVLLTWQMRWRCPQSCFIGFVGIYVGFEFESSVGVCVFLSPFNMQISGCPSVLSDWFIYFYCC